MKPGIQTTEFWLSTLPLLIYALLALNVVPHSSEIATAISAVAAALAAFGYAWARAFVKANPA